MPRSAYFLTMACLLLALVLAGFGSEFFRRSSAELAALPAHLHVHGAVLLAWFVCFLIQPLLIAVGKTRAHRGFGVLAALLGLSCIVAGPLATLGAVRSLRELGLNWDSSLDAYPALGIESLTMGQYASFLVCGNFASIFCFAVLLVAAIACRGDAGSHKRLMLLASMSLMAPAIARLARWPIFGGEDGMLIPLGMFGLFLSLALHDWRSMRRLHAATLWGSVLVALITGAGLLIATTPFAARLVQGLA